MVLSFLAAASGAFVFMSRNPGSSGRCPPSSPSLPQSVSDEGDREALLPSDQDPYCPSVRVPGPLPYHSYRPVILGSKWRTYLLLGPVWQRLRGGED